MKESVCKTCRHYMEVSKDVGKESFKTTWCLLNKDAGTLNYVTECNQHSPRPTQCDHKERERLSHINTDGAIRCKCGVWGLVDKGEVLWEEPCKDQCQHEAPKGHPLENMNGRYVECVHCGLPGIGNTLGYNWGAMKQQDSSTDVGE
jgi:hypothetical protein